MKAFSCAIAVLLICVGCNRSEPTPKPEPVKNSTALPAGHPALDMSRQSGADAPNPQWTVPAGWQEGKPGPMRRAQFSVEGAEIVVSAFPGDVGGLLANINRWRGQIGLAPASPDEVAGMTSDLEVAGTKATMVDFQSDKQRMIVIIVPHEGNSWFFKMTGAVPVVEAQKDTFAQFVKSAKF